MLVFTAEVNAERVRAWNEDVPRSNHHRFISAPLHSLIRRIHVGILLT